MAVFEATFHQSTRRSKRQIVPPVLWAVLQLSEEVRLAVFLLMVQTGFGRSHQVWLVVHRLPLWKMLKLIGMMKFGLGVTVMIAMSPNESRTRPVSHNIWHHVLNFALKEAFPDRIFYAAAAGSGLIHHIGKSMSTFLKRTWNSIVRYNVQGFFWRLPAQGIFSPTRASSISKKNICRSAVLVGLDMKGNLAGSSGALYLNILTCPFILMVHSALICPVNAAVLQQSSFETPHAKSSYFSEVW